MYDSVLKTQWTNTECNPCRSNTIKRKILTILRNEETASKNVQTCLSVQIKFLMDEAMKGWTIFTNVLLTELGLNKTDASKFRTFGAFPMRKFTLSSINMQFIIFFHLRIYKTPLSYTGLRVNLRNSRRLFVFLREMMRRAVCVRESELRAII